MSARQQQVFNYSCRDPRHRGDPNVGRENLLAKVVMFRRIGQNGKVFRQRTTDWQCFECVRNDPDFDREFKADAPGSRDLKAVGE